MNLCVKWSVRKKRMERMERDLLQTVSFQSFFPGLIDLIDGMIGMNIEIMTTSNLF